MPLADTELPDWVKLQRRLVSVGAQVFPPNAQPPAWVPSIVPGVKMPRVYIFRKSALWLMMVNSDTVKVPCVAGTVMLKVDMLSRSSAPERVNAASEIIGE